MVLHILEFLNSNYYTMSIGASQVVQGVNYLPASAGDVRDLGSIPGSGRSLGEGHGNPLQSSFWENHMGRGAWWSKVHGVTKSWT